MTDLTYRQKEALSNSKRMEIYSYLQKGVEPATASEIASEFDMEHGVAVYDLWVLVDAKLAERIPAEQASESDTYRALEIS